MLLKEAIHACLGDSFARALPTAPLVHDTSSRSVGGYKSEYATTLLGLSGFLLQTHFSQPFGFASAPRDRTNGLVFVRYSAGTMPEAIVRWANVGPVVPEVRMERLFKVGPSVDQTFSNVVGGIVAALAGAGTPQGTNA